MSGHVGDLSKEQDAALQQMKQEIDSDEPTLLRFLRARQFHVPEAITMFKNCMNWRKEIQIDKILNANLPKSDLFAKLVPHKFHGFDNDGRPIYIEKIGSVDYPTVYEHMNDDELGLHHLYQMEKQVDRCRESSQRLNKNVENFCNIVDLTNLNMRHRAGVRLIKLIAQQDQAYYPERLGKIYVINAPWVFPFFWKLVRGWIDKKTAEKVVVLGKNYQKQLLKFIPAEHLPEEFGGKCTCNGKGKPCVPVSDISDLRTKNDKSEEKLEQELAGDLVEKVVGARDTFEVKYDVPAGGAGFEWSFKVAAKDIKFSLEAFDAHGKKVAIPQLDHPLPGDEPVAHHAGAMSVKIGCTVVFRWDNSYSYFTSKTISYFARMNSLAMTADDVRDIEYSVSRSEMKSNEDDDTNSNDNNSNNIADATEVVQISAAPMSPSS